MTYPAWLTIPNVIQAVLAGAAIWYTIETRRYRRHSELQLRLLQEQDRLRRQPALIVGVKRWAEEAIVGFLRTQMHMTSEAEIQERLGRCRAREPILVCTVRNVRESPPVDVKAILFDPVKQRFLLSDQGSDIIPQGESVTYTFTDREETCLELIRRLQEESRGYRFLAAHLEGSTEPFVAVVFKDVAGQEYLFQRPYSVQEAGGIRHKPGRLDVLPTLAES